MHNKSIWRRTTPDCKAQLIELIQDKMLAHEKTVLSLSMSQPFYNLTNLPAHNRELIILLLFANNVCFISV